MPITTIHKYINKYPIPKNSKYLIIGTIHPHNVENFSIDFFYGNIGSFWDILSNAFPQQTFRNKNEIINTLNKYNVAITDIIMQCDRENENKTSDKDLYNIIINKEQIDNGIRNSEIDTIYFTSRFGANNAAKLFVESFNIKYEFNESNSEFSIPANHFGRPIRCVVLYSPSNMANIGISQSLPYLNNLAHFQKYDNPIKQFKVEFYQDKFSFLNDLL